MGTSEIDIEKRTRVSIIRVILKMEMVSEIETKSFLITTIARQSERNDMKTRKGCDSKKAVDINR
jgi:hypothetical protein